MNCTDLDITPSTSTKKNTPKKDNKKKRRCTLSTLKFHMIEVYKCINNLKRNVQLNIEKKNFVDNIDNSAAVDCIEIVDEPNNDSMADNNVDVKLNLLKEQNETCLNKLLKNDPNKLEVGTNKNEKQLTEDAEVKIKSEPNDALLSTYKMEKNLVISLLSDDENDYTNNQTISNSENEFDQNKSDDQLPVFKIEANTTTGDNKCRKRKLEDGSRKHNGKKKKSISLDNTNELFDVIYKVKLSNLPRRIQYIDVASLLKKAGLEFADILLIKNCRKSHAEVSFNDPDSKEKAISLDNTLSHSGSKIKIQSL